MREKEKKCITNWRKFSLLKWDYFFVDILKWQNETIFIDEGSNKVREKKVRKRKRD